MSGELLDTVAMCGHGWGGTGHCGAQRPPDIVFVKAESCVWRCATDVLLMMRCCCATGIYSPPDLRVMCY